MFKILRRSFKRKKHAPTIYHAGGYPTNTDLHRMSRSGEAVINIGKYYDIAKRCGMTVDDQRFKDALLEVLDDIEDSGVIINEDELESRISECAEEFKLSSKVAKIVNENLNRMLGKSIKVTNCPNCGAALHNGKCEYCGTETL